jgi:hypothetical protein
MALDVYCWLAYRLHSLTADKPISWAALAGQFGGGIRLRKHFKAAFSESLGLALAVYRDARVDVTPTGLLPYHQYFLTRHPRNAYIAAYELPNLEELRRIFPDLYRADICGPRSGILICLVMLESVPVSA